MPSSNTSLPNPKRRNFLKVVGGGVILAAVGGAGFLATRTPHKALAPWEFAKNSGSEIDPRRTILAHAILAPNPHNRQPWEVEFRGSDEMVLYCDLERRLPHTDPFDRQITIGLGCFLELASQAASALGFEMDIEAFPQGEGFPRLAAGPIAHMKLKKSDRAPDPLFAQIFDRRSNKEAFDTDKNVDAGLVDQILSVNATNAIVGKTLDGAEIKAVREITWAAMINELETRRTFKESVDLMRIGKAEIEASPDGIDLGGAFFDSLYAMGMLSREDMLSMSEFQLNQAKDATRPAIQSAMGYVWVKTSGNTRVDQINAGRSYVRLNLKATELGIDMHPLSQALQEFEEVSEQHQQIKNAIGVSSSETLQMLARIGYGSEQAPSPRWGYEHKIRDV